MMDRNSGGGNGEDCSSGSRQSGGSRSGESNISGRSDRAGSSAWEGAGSVSSSNSTTTTITNSSTAAETCRNSLPRVKLHSIENALAVSDRQPTSPLRVEHHNPAATDIPNVVEYHLKVKTDSRNSVVVRENKKAFENLQPPISAAMKKEEYRASSMPEDNKARDFARALRRLSIDKNVFEGSQELPQVFQVKYLGSHDARGLWGIKHTRKPVDNMVAAAKALPTSTLLPLVKLIVTKEGVAFVPLEKKKQDLNTTKVHPIETISYGVQDLTYTRVFCMIVVRESDHFRKVPPFVCHAFVCESKQHARQLTYALATAFHLYSTIVKRRTQPKEEDCSLANCGTSDRKASEATALVATCMTANSLQTISRCTAIDLRSGEEMEGGGLALDSEA